MTEGAPIELKPVGRRIDFPTIRRYGQITDDPNPIHTDRDFAKTTAMGGIIAHGTLSLNLIWQSIRATFGSEAIAHAVLDVRFVAPVREDDVVTAGGRQMQGACRRFEVWARNQAGHDVVEGTLEFPDSAPAFEARAGTGS